MKFTFEKREKTITSGLLAMLVSAAQSEKMKKEYKFTNKLLEKLQGENLEVNLKPDEVKTIKMILDTVVKEGEQEVGPEELPKMNSTDLETCKVLQSKLK